MVETYLRQSPLDRFRPAAAAYTGPEAGVTLTARPFAGQVALRGDAASESFRDAVAEVVGAALPVEPTSVSTGGSSTILWLGPDEWLLVVADGSQGQVMRDLGERLAGEHHAVTDVSSSRIVMRLSGPRAREVLAKGCSLDLHPRVFGAGRCAQSGLARCHMLLHQVDDEPSFDVYVHRSFADYAWRWLADAAREYGLATGA